MKIGPDGSLCRITSSAKDLINNVRITKVPDSQPLYKLVVIRPNNEHEEASEKSDEEMSDNELFNINFPSKDTRKEKVVDTKIVKSNETVNEGVMRERYHNRQQPYHKRNNRPFVRRNNFNKNKEGIYNYGNRDFNPSTNHDFNSAKRKFNSSVNREFNSAPNRDFTSGSNRTFPNVPNRDFNSAGNRSFTSTSNHLALHHNTDNYQHASDDFPFSPWLEPPPLHPNYSIPSYSLGNLPENPRNSFGLLGDRPSYAPSLPPPFQPNKPSDDYILDQNLTYTPIASTFVSNHNNNFVHNQDLPYSQRTSNYASGKNSDNFIHKQNYRRNTYGNYKNNNQYGNKQLNDKNKQDSRRHHRRHQNQY